MHWWSPVISAILSRTLPLVVTPNVDVVGEPDDIDKPDVERGVERGKVRAARTVRRERHRLQGRGFRTQDEGIDGQPRSVRTASDIPSGLLLLEVHGNELSVVGVMEDVAHGVAGSPQVHEMLLALRSNHVVIERS